jgi:hypothetical protein
MWDASRALTRDRGTLISQKKEKNQKIHTKEKRSRDLQKRLLVDIFEMGDVDHDSARLHPLGREFIILCGYPCHNHLESGG